MLRLSSAFLAILIVIPSFGLAQSQTVGQELSDVERAALARILNDVGTKQGDELKAAVTGEIAGLVSAGKDARLTIGLAKLGAGTNLAALQRVLVDQCLTPGGAAYCRLAALPASATVDGSGVQTAATGTTASDTGTAPAGGLADGFGGGVQTNSGSGRGPIASLGSSPIFRSGGSQQFSLNPSFSNTTVVRTAAAFIAVPGPVAGAGVLPLLAVLGAWHLTRRRRRAVDAQ